MIVQRVSVSENTPQAGDTLVTLTCDPDKPLEERMNLAYVFTKIANGATLRKVVRFDIVGGCVEFIVKTYDLSIGPVGSMTVDFEDWNPTVTVTAKKIKNSGELP
jgi:hypothetical protein